MTTAHFAVGSLEQVLGVIMSTLMSPQVINVASASEGTPFMAEFTGLVHGGFLVGASVGAAVALLVSAIAVLVSAVALLVSAVALVGAWVSVTGSAFCAVTPEIVMELSAAALAAISPAV